jgi:hypothetical protein
MWKFALFKRGEYHAFGGKYNRPIKEILILIVGPGSQYFILAVLDVI